MLPDGKVIAVDNDGKILNINQAAARLFHIDATSSIGKNVYEIIRFKELKVTGRKKRR